MGSDHILQQESREKFLAVRPRIATLARMVFRHSPEPPPGRPDPRRVLYVCQELPYPIRNGHDQDVARRLRALADAGVAMFLVGWAGWVESGGRSGGKAVGAGAVAGGHVAPPVHAGPPADAAPPAHAHSLATLTPDWRALAFSRGLRRRLLQLPGAIGRPAPVLTRTVSGAHYSEILAAARRFAPGMVFIDGLFAADLGAPLGARPASDLRLSRAPSRARPPPTAAAPAGRRDRQAAATGPAAGPAPI